MIRVMSVLLSCLAISALPADADTITYLFEGSNSGSLGGQAYVDAPFTIIAHADTADPTDLLSAVFTVTGVGSGTLSGYRAFVNNLNCDANQEFPAVDSCVGIGLAPNGEDLMDVASNVFDAYVLGNPIGPITDLTSFGNVGLAFPTSVGDWIIDVYGPATFTAAVPEPTTLTLGALGLAGFARKRIVARRLVASARARTNQRAEGRRVSCRLGVPTGLA